MRATLAFNGLDALLQKYRFAPYHGFMFTLEVAFIVNLKHFHKINQSFFSSAILE